MDGVFEFVGREPGTVYFIVSAGLIIATFLATMFVKAEADSPIRRKKHRLEKMARRAQGIMLPTSEAITVRRQKKDSSFAAVDRFIKNYVPRPALLRQRLTKAGLRMSLGEYLMMSLLVGIAGAGGVLYFLKFNLLICFFAGVPIGIMLPHYLVSFLVARRRKKFNANFPEAIELIVRGLKSGLPVGESIKTVAQELPKPVGTEFAEIASTIALGRTMEDAMWDAAKRIDIPEFNFFVISLAVQKETGGNLAETLENLADILRRRRQMKLKIKALSSEARASAYIIASLPFIMFGIIYVLNPGYVMQLFSDPRGHVMLGVGATMLSIGIGTMVKMVRFEI